MLRPADQPRNQDAARRHAVLRSRQVQTRTRRGHEHRRHVGHLQTEEERQIPRRHAGHGQGCQMVARSRGHGRRLPHRADEGRLAVRQGAVRPRRRQHRSHRFRQERSADDSRSRGDRAEHLQFRTPEKEGHGKGSVGARIHQEQHRRQRRLQGDELEAGRRSGLRAQRGLGRRQAAPAQEGDLAHRSLAGQSPRPDGTRRCRHLLRSVEQGHLRDEEGRQARHHLQSDRQRHVFGRSECEEPAVR